MAASVVDLPAPVGPVTSTRPLPMSSTCRHWSGSPIVSRPGGSEAMTRMTAAIPPMWR